MANTKFTSQQQTKVSIDKESLKYIAASDDMSKKDYKLLIILFTELRGWNDCAKVGSIDPRNFTLVDIESIAKTLNMSKKEVRKSLINLEDYGLIEEGSSDTVEDGYRFTF